MKDQTDPGMHQTAHPEPHPKMPQISQCDSGQSFMCHGERRWIMVGADSSSWYVSIRVSPAPQAKSRISRDGTERAWPTQWLRRANPEYQTNHSMTMGTHYEMTIQMRKRMATQTYRSNYLAAMLSISSTHWSQLWPCHLVLLHARVCRAALKVCMDDVRRCLTTVFYSRFIVTVSLPLSPFSRLVMRCARHPPLYSSSSLTR